MDLYYFDTSDSNGYDCIEPCQLKLGVMIGSVSCQECENCIGKAKPDKSTKAIAWIACKRIEEAIPAAEKQELPYSQIEQHWRHFDQTDQLGILSSLAAGHAMAALSKFTSCLRLTIAINGKYNLPTAIDAMQFIKDKAATNGKAKTA